MAVERIVNYLLEQGPLFIVAVLALSSNMLALAIIFRVLS